MLRVCDGWPSTEARVVSDQVSWAFSWYLIRRFFGGNMFGCLLCLWLLTKIAGAVKIKLSVV